MIKVIVFYNMKENIVYPYRLENNSKKKNDYRMPICKEKV